MIDSKTLKYKAFTDPRKRTVSDFEEGFSGPLLIGTDKAGKKYIVKHTEITDASNEFVACYLAEKMGIPAPKAYLLSPNKRFNSPYAVAIEFLEGIKPLGEYGELTQSDKADVCAQLAFSMMLYNGDNAQLSRYNGQIVQLDFSDTFSMSSMLLKAAYCMNQREFAKDLIKRSSEAFAGAVRRMEFDIPGIAKILEIDLKEMKSIMAKTVKKVLDVTEEDVKEIADELSQLYPPEYVSHYVDAVAVLQEYAGNL